MTLRERIADYAADLVASAEFCLRESEKKKGVAAGYWRGKSIQAAEIANVLTDMLANLEDVECPPEPGGAA